mmetsp:Transcript_13348/g.29437  ORF Transcript_13348/g.29437 Transcript_13348/m.29437 type:complete len:225 (-) Transcript_13348:65-739(-)
MHGNLSAPAIEGTGDVDTSTTVFPFENSRYGIFLLLFVFDLSVCIHSVARRGLCLWLLLLLLFMLLLLLLLRLLRLLRLLLRRQWLLAAVVSSRWKLRKLRRWILLVVIVIDVPSTGWQLHPGWQGSGGHTGGHIVVGGLLDARRHDAALLLLRRFATRDVRRIVVMSTGVLAWVERCAVWLLMVRVALSRFWGWDIAHGAARRGRVRDITNVSIKSADMAPLW